MTNQKTKDMNYNDIDTDIKLQATEEGFIINDYLKSVGVNPEQYIALLLLLPDDAEKRNEIHRFLEDFNNYLKNGSHNTARENGTDFTYSDNGITFYVAYQVLKGFSRSIDPADFDDEEIVEASLINTDLPEDAWKWLNYQCKVILTKWESFNF